MWRNHRKARLIILSPIVLAFSGWFIAFPGRELVVTAYDMATSSSCRKDIEAAVDTFAKQTDETDYNRSDALIGQDMADHLRQLRAKVADTRCPTFADKAKTELLDAIDQTTAVMDAIAHGAQADFDQITKAFAFTREKLDALRKLLP